MLLPNTFNLKIYFCIHWTIKKKTGLVGLFLSMNGSYWPIVDNRASVGAGAGYGTRL